MCIKKQFVRKSSKYVDFCTQKQVDLPILFELDRIGLKIGFYVSDFKLLY